MLFLEATRFFVRTIAFDFISKEALTKLKFRLVPMIHIGTKEYYQKTLDHLRDCEEIMYEGLSDKRLKLMFRQYKKMAEALDLVTQTEHFKLGSLNADFVHVDYNPEQSRVAAKALSLKEKLKLFLLKPMQLALARRELSREILSKHFMTEAQESYLAYGPDEEEGTAAYYINGQREQLIFEKIDEKIETEGGLDKTVGIVYGAGHMEKVARHLIDKHDFMGVNGKFLRVFDVY